MYQDSKLDIQHLRSRIDLINEEILALVNQRTEVVLQIRKLKEAQGLSARDSARELAQIQSLLLKNPGPASAATIENLYKAIFSCAIQDSEYSKPLVPTSLFLGQGPVTIGNVEVGGEAPPIIIAGPCALESARQIDLVADFLQSRGISFLRAGCFKPRTSPLSFQGLGLGGLPVLAGVRNRTGMLTVTEITSKDQLEAAQDAADILQVGTRNMFNYDLLKSLARQDKPVLLKRHFAASFDEWLMAAEYLAGQGNTKVLLCERGIRTIEPGTRNTLDLVSVALIRERYGIPVLVDVSHAAGRKDVLLALARASLAAGADGIMVEVHENPQNALCDARQQLSFDEFDAFLNALGAYLIPRKGGVL